MATKQAKKIMIIEDDSFSLKLYASYLEKEGFAVIATPQADEVLRLAKQAKPNLFIVDLMLQGGDGFILVDKIRHTAGFKNTPIIVLSNLGQDSDITRAKKLGANKYFIKSNVRFQEVVDTVRELV
ncbi:MAG TPA: response regulator [Patescibacteria group bacterium]|nr:response regulator [Patescibacteria group bacterium]